MWPCLILAPFENPLLSVRGGLASFGEDDPPLHAISAPLTLARERSYAEKNTALRRTRSAGRTNGSFRRLAHAGAIHEHRRGTSSRAKQCRHLRYFPHGTIDCGGSRRMRMAQHYAHEQRREARCWNRSIHLSAERAWRHHR